MATVTLTASDLLTRAAEEILGGEVRALPALSSDLPARDRFARLQSDLEEIYGLRAGAGLALRIGRALFHHGLRAHGHSIGLDGSSFRLLPFAAKMRTASAAFAGLFERQAGIVLNIEQTADQLTCHLGDCPLCGDAGRQSGCHLAVGLLQEALYWLSGGRQYPIEETACRRAGAPGCVLTVDLARGA